MQSLFINVGLVAGTALVALPLILHLFLRPKPKRLTFPALRLVKERHQQTRRKLKVKNWLLLLARMALIALMALALARPRLWSRTSLGDREVPTAMAIVFDTSLSMAYKERDKTRLDEAKEQARTLLRRAHEGSRVLVFDSFDPVVPAELTPGAALKQVEALTLHPANRPLNAAMSEAYKAVAKMDQPRREVYAFTDLSRTAWDSGQSLARPKEAAAKKEQGPDTATYIVRLAPKELRNAAVVEVEPAAGFGAAGEPVPVRVVVRGTGGATSRLAEFLVNGTKRAQKPLEIPANGEVTVLFETPKLEVGLHRCEVRLGGEPDPLAEDDRRYLSLEVVPPQRVLVVSDQEIDASFVAEALDPAVLRQSSARPFPVTTIRSGQLSGGLKEPLASFATVFLLNIQEIPEAAWGQLNRYVRDGGGLVVGLGSRVVAESANRLAAGLLPAALGAVEKAPAAEFTFGKADVDHPLFARNTKDLLAELARVPVYAYMSAKPVDAGRVLLEYQNGAPALLERVFPGPRPGHVLLWTTALARRPGNTPAERAANWTDFPLPTVGWSFFYLMNETVPYLAGIAGRRLTYEAGEDVVLTIDASRRHTSYTIQGPGTQAERIGQPVAGQGLLIQAPPLVGDWTVVASGGDEPARTLGFSVNVPSSESQLAPMTEEDLIALFGGKDRFALADNPAQIRTVVDNVRIGRELFPLLMWLILALVIAENLLANSFYRERPSGSSEPAGRGWRRRAA